MGPDIQLEIVSNPGVTNQIQTTTNLSQAPWVALTNLMVNQTPYLFIDKGAALENCRFYRVVVLSAETSTTPSGMVLIPAGAFQMGDTFYEGAVFEIPIHTVDVSAFYMDEYEVTKNLWDQVKTWSADHGYGYDNAGSGKATNHPVQSIDWYDAVKWCNARSEREGRVPAYYTDSGLTQVYKTGQVAPYVNWHAGYRLPTEAEWEKADRGGASGHRFPWSNVETITHTQANYYSDSSYSYDISPTRGYNPKFNDGVMPLHQPGRFICAEWLRVV